MEIDAPNVGGKRKIYPGTVVVAAYDFDGNEQWKVKPGSFVSAHGFCSCPVFFKDLVIINGDHDGKSYILALNKKTGDVVWKVPRKYGIRSYVTPLIRNVGGRTQMVFSGSKHIISLDPSNGKQHWRVEGPTEQFVSSMVYDGQQFYMCAGFPTYHVMAIDGSGQGDVTDTAVKWHVKNVRCYVPSPVVIGKYLIVADDRGTANCFDTKTGERHWQNRLGNHFSASLLSVNGLAYLLADDGTVIDDIIVYRQAWDRFVVVVNAANADVDLAWIRAVAAKEVAIDPRFPGRRIEGEVTIRDLKDPGSGADQKVDLALQGPRSFDCLRSLAARRDAERIERLDRFHFVDVDLAGVSVMVSRTGYTGEPIGFEPVGTGPRQFFRVKVD